MYQQTHNQLTRPAEQFVFRQTSTDTLFFFEYSPTLFGRSKNKCHLILSHGSVSKIHCAVFFSRDALCLCDLGSRNGVYVNQRKVRFKKLAAGDMVRIGIYRFQYMGFIRYGSSKFEVPISEPAGTKQQPDDLKLDDLAIAPPPAPDTSPKVEDPQLFEDDEFDAEIENALEENVEVELNASGGSSYQLQSPSRKYDGPPKLKRKTFSSPREEEPHPRISFDMAVLTQFKEKLFSGRLILIVCLILIVWGLKALWFSDRSDAEIYHTLQAKLDTIQTYRQEGASPEQWNSLVQQTETELQPLVSYLEENASSENRIKQELLRAARDCLPKVMQDSRLQPSYYETRLEQHLEQTRHILENGSIEERSFDPRFPDMPPGG